MAVSLVGTSTTSCARRSPRPRPRTIGTPRPRRVKTLPDCVPAGTRSSSSPSRVGRTSVVPSAAWTIDTVTVVDQVVAGPRVALVRLHPQMDVEVARFTATRTDRAPPGEAEGGAVVDAGRHVHLVGAGPRLAGHAPAHASHGVTMSCPKPPQRGQAEVVTIWPSRLWRTRRTWPAPAHSAQVTGWVPGEVPWPSQVSHRMAVLTVTGRVVPKTAASKEMLASTSRSCPRGGPVGPGWAATERAAAEEGVEQVAEPTAAPEDVARPAGGSGHPRLAETVVHGPLLGIRKDLIGARDGLEPLLGRRITRIGVRVELPRALPVGALDVLRRSVRADAQERVEVLGHGVTRLLPLPV